MMGLLVTKPRPFLRMTTLGHSQGVGWTAAHNGEANSLFGLSHFLENLAIPAEIRPKNHLPPEMTQQTSTELRPLQSRLTLGPAECVKQITG